MSKDGGSAHAFSGDDRSLHLVVGQRWKYPLKKSESLASVAEEEISRAITFWPCSFIFVKKMSTVA
jgi:hypothetical protein